MALAMAAATVLTGVGFEHQGQSIGRQD